MKKTNPKKPQTEAELCAYRCDWKENKDGWWSTDCGSAFNFTNGSPIYNRFKNCPYCGKALTETPYSDEIPDASSKAALELMVERGAKAWRDVPDAGKWVEELRGNDAS